MRRALRRLLAGASAIILVTCIPMRSAYGQIIDPPPPGGSTDTPVLNIIATDPGASEAGPNPGTFRVYRSGDTNTGFTAYYDVGGTASNGVDYVALTYAVSFPAGAMSAEITVLPMDDSLLEGNETVVIRLIVPPFVVLVFPPPPPSYVLGPSNLAVVTIEDNDRNPTNEPPFVRLNSPQEGDVFTAPADIRLMAFAQDAEDGQNVKVEFFEGANRLGFGTFVPTLCPAPYCPYFTLTWSNVPPGEYTLTAKATDNAGAVAVSESVHVAVRAESPLPVVRIDATGRIAEEDSSPFDRINLVGEFTISRTGPTNAPLPVWVQYSGSATPGNDYPQLPLRVTIPEGSNSTTIRVEAIPDDATEGIETLVATVSNCPPPWSLAPCYVFDIDPAHESATVFIRDNGLMQASLAITNPKEGTNFNVGETILIEATAIDLDGYINRVEFWDGDHSIGVSEIAFFRAPDPGTPIHHSFAWTGAAPGGHELNARGISTLGAALVSRTVNITVLAVTNHPPVIVSIVATDPEAEEIPPVPPGMGMPQRYNPAVFTVWRTGGTNESLEVHYNVGGTAGNGVDYSLLSGVVTIPAGSSSAIIEVSPNDDVLVEGDETVLITLEAPMCIAVFPPPPGCYSVGESYRATAVIHDNDPRPPVPAPDDQEEPSVASNGDGYFVVWADKRNYGSNEYDIYGARVSATGEVLDPAGIPICTDPGRQTSPRVAFDGERYLVVWEDDRESTPDFGIYQIYGARVTRDGHVLDPNGFKLTTNRVARTGPAVASNGRGFFVVWVDWMRTDSSIADIYGSLVSSDGVVAHPDGVPLVQAPMWQADPRIVSANGEYLVTFWNSPDPTGGNNIWGLRLSSNGVASASAFRISNSGQAGDRHGLASNGRDYFAVWGDDRGSPSGFGYPKVYGTLVRSNGTVVSPSGIPIATSALYQERPKVAADGNGFLVVWQESNDAHAETTDLYGARLTDGGAVGTPSRIAVNSSPGVQINADIAFAGENFLMAWQDGRGAPGQTFPLGAYDIYGTLVGRTGLVSNTDGFLISGFEPNQPPTNPPVMVSIVATDPEAEEIPPVPPGMGMPQRYNPAVFTVSRTGGTNESLEVHYNVGGTAGNGVDYSLLSGVVTIPAGSSSAIIEVSPIDDLWVEGEETATVNIQPGECPPVIFMNSPVRMSGQGSTGPGGWDLALSAEVTANGTTGQMHLAGGATGPLIQVVPPGNDGCACWCFNARRTDVEIVGPDFRENVYIRDVGDGITTFDQVSFVSSIGGDCNTISAAELFFLPLVQGDFKAVVLDSDGDGVPDYRDWCPNTADMAAVNEHGCSLDQIIACGGYRVGEQGSATVVIRDNDRHTDQPPAVAITSPSDGETFTAPANIEISADASDGDGEVLWVEFFADGRFVGRDHTSPYSAVWHHVPPGNHVLRARAVDNHRGRTLSAPVNVTVVASSNLLPRVSIAMPENGATFAAPADIWIFAQASDADGWVPTVEFFEGTNSLSVATNNPLIMSPINPYHLLWTNVPAGEYTLRAKATDDQGATTISEPVRIAVGRTNLSTIVNLAAVNSLTIEGTTNPGRFSISRIGTTSAPLTVHYAIGGTASNGVDYAAIGDSATIPAGEHSVAVNVFALADDVREEPERVTLALSPVDCDTSSGSGECYRLGPSSNASVYIVDPPGISPGTNGITGAGTALPAWLCTKATVSDGQCRLAIVSQPGAIVTIEVSNDLVNWQPLATLENTEGVLDFADPSAGKFDRSFYRVVVEP